MTTTITDPDLLDAAQGMLETLDEMDQWDLPPYVILVIGGDRKGFIEVPIPEQVWASAHPAEAIQLLAAGIASGAVALDVEGDDGRPMVVIGALLITEGHTIDSASLDEHEKSMLDDFTERHRIEEHSKAKELRMATMVDRALNVNMYHHVRGEKITTELMDGITGRIPDALSALMTALAASWIERAEESP